MRPLLEPLRATAGTNGVLHLIDAHPAARYQSGSGFCAGKGGAPKGRGGHGAKPASRL